MFNLAGMQQLIPYLAGKEHPLGKRLFNIQKCVRTNDIDEVGDATHLTMFEMMGNRSLGDYFKKESIEWSRDFLTKPERLDLNEKKIAVTVFAWDDNAPRDEESAGYWRDMWVSKISYLGADDNRRSPWPLWPCGPDTEIFYRVGEGLPPADSDVASDPDNWMEIWNNVFMEYYRDDTGTLTKLPAQNVDTGMWFERMCMVLEDKSSPYDTDVFADVFKILQESEPKREDKEKNTERLKELQATPDARIFVDHMRTSLLLIYSGVVPSNTWPGYILRSLIRRAYFLHVYYYLGEKAFDLNINKTLESIQKYWETFYDISIPNGSKIITEEISKFQKTLKLWDKEVQKIIDSTDWNIISWDKVFLLSDTFWFPLELTKKIAQNAGMTIDEAWFRIALEQQKTRSRQATKGKFTLDVDRSAHIQGMPATEFIGYDTLNTDKPKLLKDFAVNGQRVLIFDRTPFYAEGGWQTGDKGIIKLDTGEKIIINDVKKYENIFLHFVR